MQAGPSNANGAVHPYYQQQQLQVRTGQDWTQSLIQLAKTAELKKHALALQMQTAHVLAAHEDLKQWHSTLENVKAARNWLESERESLLAQLRMVNEDREQVDQVEADALKRCNDVEARIQTITEGEYSSEKTLVDKLRAELGMMPMRSLQSILDEKSASYLQERRLAQQPRSSDGYTNGPTGSIHHRLDSPNGSPSIPHTSNSGIDSSTSKKRPGRPPKHPRPEGGDHGDGEAPPRKRGRPKGSKNKTTAAETGSPAASTANRAGNSH